MPLCSYSGSIATMWQFCLFKLFVKVQCAVNLYWSSFTLTKVHSQSSSHCQLSAQVTVFLCQLSHCYCCWTALRSRGFRALSLSLHTPFECALHGSFQRPSSSLPWGNGAWGWSEQVRCCWPRVRFLFNWPLRVFLGGGRGGSGEDFSQSVFHEFEISCRVVTGMRHRCK